MRTIDTEGVCAVCPFGNLVWGLGRCAVGYRHLERDVHPWEESPDWCPLREGPVTVRLEGGDDGPA
jgi:hypothetical protein